MTYRVTVKDNNGKQIRVVASGVSDNRAALIENGANINLDGRKFYTVVEPDEVVELGPGCEE